MQSVDASVLKLFCSQTLYPLGIILVNHLWVLFLSAITLDNTLVILSTVAPDAGRYYVQAVNDKNGDNKTSQPITLSVDSECSETHAAVQRQIQPGC